jgi:hypothetical protein
VANTPLSEPPQREGEQGGGTLTAPGPSGLDKGIPPLAFDRKPLGNRPLLPRAAASCPVTLACSKHGRGGCWQIADFCEECDRIAEAALAASL